MTVTSRPLVVAAVVVLLGGLAACDKSGNDTSAASTVEADYGVAVKHVAGTSGTADATTAPIKIG
ncbi:hypothetical protein [Cryptosporangium sp. NPDC051539]|uniref:hypothetical protein n=1 Tax=Cryptosporangium sp. NPDC051539 TaxID=3363962 RepID=UPI0037B9E925